MKCLITRELPVPFFTGHERRRNDPRELVNEEAVRVTVIIRSDIRRMSSEENARINVYHSEKAMSRDTCIIFDESALSLKNILMTEQIPSLCSLRFMERISAKK